MWRIIFCGKAHLARFVASLNKIFFILDLFFTHSCSLTIACHVLPNLLCTVHRLTLWKTKFCWCTYAHNIICAGYTHTNIAKPNSKREARVSVRENEERTKDRKKITDTQLLQLWQECSKKEPLNMIYYIIVQYSIDLVMSSDRIYCTYSHRRSDEPKIHNAYTHTRIHAQHEKRHRKKREPMETKARVKRTKS